MLEPWWLRRLPIASSPCSLGFFHEVGAKLLVEMGPEGGRRHNSPLLTPLPFGGKRPGDHPRKRAGKLETRYSPVDSTLWRY
jgi:hypothetical protein